MSDTRSLFLEEMGLTRWQLRIQTTKADQEAEPVEANPPLAADAALPPAVTPAPVLPASAFREALSPTLARQAEIARMDWETLEAASRNCSACGLCQMRKQAVPGVGDRHPDWLFIGEGPGAEEDAQGEPFVGQAGKLLDAMLASIGLRRGNRVYIANAVKCRPEGNRTPHPDEMATCRPFLQRQIALLQPRLIVLLGKAAMHSVLGEDRSLASMRQRIWHYEHIPVLVTYHPAYLLRNLPEKIKVWEDLCLARRTMAQQSTTTG
ncbi:MAG: uracil-DNA glycosylase [Zoogloeaceae bacterium]|nr:uracil-DNA glycosylase [Zoogloeaceae bacterium]